ncbi:hypothetical protein JCM10207_001699 [Rhodosporidiobolus poonsookiae]
MSSSIKAANNHHGGRRSGRKGDQTDLNHLLGFTLPPRPPQPTLTHLPRRSNNRSRSTYSSGSGWGGAAADRARFVHTFRFIVKPDKDYTAHFADPDIHLDWADILQVILPTASSALSTVTTQARIDQAGDAASGEGKGKPACPICLSEPTAARMTKCGHVFCYPCVLHYLALADPGIRFRKCPVCHDSIYAKDLKSVKWFDPVAGSSSLPSSTSASSGPPSSHPAPRPSAPLEPLDTDLARALELSRLDAAASPPSTSTPTSSPRAERLTMRLVRRPQLTTLALPRSASWPSDAVPPLRAPWQFTPDAFAYAKFMLGEPAYMRDELLRERRELESELAMLRRFGGTEDELGTVFVEQAIAKVDEQVAMVELLKTTQVMTARKRALRDLEELELGEAEERGKPAPLPAQGPPAAAAADASAVPAEMLASRGTTPLSTDAAPFVPASSSSAPASDPAPTLAPPTPSSPSKRPHQRRNVLPAGPPADADPAYYFYQASSGQPIFLTPLDIRILKSHFGTYQAMPDVITLSVEAADEGSMNDELRRRCKWLAHLPLASDVVFVEADLSGIVSRKSLEPYQTALRQRRTKRRDKARKEDNARKKSEQKAHDALPVFHSTFAYGSSSPPGGLPFGFAHASSWDDTAAFPAPPSSRSVSAAAAPAPASASSRPSFASALHASSRPSAGGSYTSSAAAAWDEYDDPWNEVEERLGRARAASPRTGGGGGGGGGGSGAATPARSAGAEAGAGQGKKKKGKKGITLTLGGSLRGTA